MTSNSSISSNRRATVGATPALRDPEELEATLLPFVDPYMVSLMDDVDLPTATPVVERSKSPRSARCDVSVASCSIASSQSSSSSNSHRSRHSWHPAATSVVPLEEAPVVAPYPTDDRYKARQRLSAAVEQGRRASHAERVTVMQNNRKVSAYNNQIQLDLDRANEVARLENTRERQLRTPTLSHAIGNTTSTATSKEEKLLKDYSSEQQEEAASYFPKNKRGTEYAVKEYDLDEYDSEYKYDISEYKSEYDP